MRWLGAAALAAALLVVAWASSHPFCRFDGANIGSADCPREDR